MTKFDYLFERVRLGIDVHPSEIEMEELVSIAQKISPHGDFVYKGCQSCVNYIVKFVDENKNRLDAKEEEPIIDKQ
ncbi:MAG: hypothetical protein ACOVNU_13950 [Candidatus Kapaibacteriota bacterium]